MDVFWQSPCHALPVIHLPNRLHFISHCTIYLPLLLYLPACPSSGWDSDLSTDFLPSHCFLVNQSFQSSGCSFASNSGCSFILLVNTHPGLISKDFSLSMRKSYVLASVHCSKLFSQHPSSHSEFQRTRVVSVLQTSYHFSVSNHSFAKCIFFLFQSQSQMPPSTQPSSVATVRVIASSFAHLCCLLPATLQICILAPFTFHIERRC